MEFRVYLRYIALLSILMCSAFGTKGECKQSPYTAQVLFPERAQKALLFNRQHLDLLNYLIVMRGYKSYLEIGVADGHNLSSVAASHKVGVDPSPAPNTSPIHRMTSDEFFNMNHEMFDLIFIDGLHLHEQVLKDVENSLKCLNPGGLIVMHDCMPNTPEQQLRTPVPGAWNGDVWKAVAYMRMHLEDVDLCVLDMDWGCGILTPNSHQTLIPELPISNMDWDYYAKNKQQVLNVKSVEEWVKNFQ
ncbi:MAG: class I SAM-dependent methyltransferase [Rhabdochlamydiaceae bacterium]|jgi:hypothetical protein